MPGPLPPWDIYARLQDELARRHHADHRAWGLEEALNNLLAPSDEVRSDESCDRTARSASRKERYRARLRGIHLVSNGCSAPPEDSLDARRALAAAEATLSPTDWMLLRLLAEGHDYARLALASHISEGCLRIRVLRLRRSLRPMLAARDEDPGRRLAG